jgi:hypothetical protein
MGPMTNFVRKRKSLAPVGTILTNCDDGSIVASDDPGFAPLKFAKADTGAEMKRYCLKIDVLRFNNS